MRNALCLEAFGTFFLCLAAAVAGEPLAVAAVLGALIYAGGPISGAHYNPAATLAWCVRGRHRWLPGVAYALVQLTAALAAAAVAGLLAGHDPERTAAAARAIAATVSVSTRSSSWARQRLRLAPSNSPFALNS